MDVADSSRLTELAMEISVEVSGVSFCLAHMSFLRCSWCSMPIESMRSDSRSSARKPPSTCCVDGNTTAEVADVAVSHLCEKE